MSGLAFRFDRPYLVSVIRRPRPPSDVTTLRSVVQEPCGSTVTVNVRPCSSIGGGLRGRDRGLAPERLALVAEDQRPAVDTGVVGAQLRERVLDLEQVGEVGCGLDPDRQVGRLGAVAEDRQLLVEPEADGALADDRQLGVDVHGARRRDEEEAGLEVLEVVGGQGVQPQVVDRQDPRRQEAHVVREQAGRIGLRRLDVAALVAHDERVAIQDPDEGRNHRLAPPLAHGSWARRLRHAHRRREQALDTDQEARVAVQGQGAAEGGGHRVAASAGHQVEVGLCWRVMTTSASASSPRVTPSSPSLIARSHWSVRPPSTMSKRTVARTLPTQRLVPALRQVVEEVSRRVSQYPDLRPPQAAVWVRAPPSRGRIAPSPRGWLATLPAHHQNCTILPLAAQGNADLVRRDVPPLGRRAGASHPMRRHAGPRTLASTSASRARSPTPITVPTPAARAATTPLGASSITTESAGSAPSRRMASA